MRVKAREKDKEEEQEVIDKGREFHKVMHDGRNDQRLSSERHQGISIVLFHWVWLARVDTQAGTASGGGPWPLVSCQNNSRKACTDYASRPASASRFSSAHLCLKATADCRWNRDLFMTAGLPAHQTNRLPAAVCNTTSIHPWSNEWATTFNLAKSAVVDFRGRRKKQVDRSASPSVDTMSVAVCEKVKHLGLQLTSTLSRTPHVDSLLHRVSHKVFILRHLAYRCRDNNFFCSLYLALVRPVLGLMQRQTLFDWKGFYFHDESLGQFCVLTADQHPTHLSLSPLDGQH